MGNLRIDMKLGDTRPDFYAQCLDGETPVPLTFVNQVLLIMRKPDDTLFSQPLTVESPAADGFVSRSWGVGDLDQIGDYRYEVEVTFGDGTKQTFPARGNGTLSVTDDLD
jgi:hypothetical protein